MLATRRGPKALLLAPNVIPSVILNSEYEGVYAGVFVIRDAFLNFHVSDSSPRGLRWKEAIARVVSEEKNFTSTTVIVEETSFRLPNLCFSENHLMAIVAFLSTRPEIIAVEPSPVLSLNNWNGAGNAQSGNVNLAPLWSAGLLGKGQVMGMSDTGLDINNCYFRQTAGGGGGVNDTSVFGPNSVGAFNNRQRKVVQYLVSGGGDNDDFLNGHGTHCAGTAVGYIAGSAIGGVNNYNGVAPDAKIAFFDGDSGNGLSFPGVWGAMYRPAMRAGVRVYSQSWGSPPTAYSSNMVNADRWLYDNPQFLSLFSAGNCGAGAVSGACPTVGPGSAGNPGTFKNGICVGASIVGTVYPNIALATFSSQGPTLDGRIKPDHVAPGTSTISAAGDTPCGTTGKQGTSMSCPLVAGLALLVRQYFMEGWYPTGVKTSVNRFVPSGALVKAMLINSAVGVKSYTASGVVTMLGPPPDNIQGFGQVMLSRVMRLGTGSTQPDLHVVSSRAITMGTVHTYKFTVRSNYVPPVSPNAVQDAFEVTLVSMDPDGLANAVKKVQNDLDLVLRRDSASSVLEYPNNLSNKDDLNNVEKIRIEAPLPNDVITVNVTGATIVSTPDQAYSLVSSGAFVAGAYFCQDPRVNRQDLQWRTEYCRVACTGVFLKSPRCCRTAVGGTGGNTCGISTPSVCVGINAPVECV